MRKVIYISFSHLTDRISKDWYIDYLIAKGMTVEYWDIVSLVREEHVDIGMKTPDYLHIAKTFSEVEAMVSLPENRDAFYVMIISCEGRFTRIFRLLSKYNCRMLFFAWAAMPAISKPVWPKILNHLCDPMRLLKIIFYMTKVYAYRKFKLIKPFDIIFAAGELMMANDQYAGRIIPINFFDYDNYITERSQEGRFLKDRYAVFLDVNLPFHNDHTIMSLPRLDAKIYYQSMNRFFKLLESFYGIKVVIAAHPTSDYGFEIFQGREIYRLQTSKLVKNAEFVISHHSTSISYAILNLKRIIFVYTNEMEFLYKDDIIMRNIYACSNYLESEMYNVDELTQGKVVVLKDINIKRYEDYKYEFLTTPMSEHTTTQEILWREIGSSD